MSLVLLPHYADEAKLEKVMTRDGFGHAVKDLAADNEAIVGLTGDLTESTRLNYFAEAFPARFFQCGVAEQNMMSIAAGLALSGKVPFATSYATFNPGRNWDQLRIACYSEANIKAVGCHSGMSVGPDGATHQGLEDMAMTRVLPNLTVLAPVDGYQAYQATVAAAFYRGPVYLRLTREPSPAFTDPKLPVVFGHADVAIEGEDVTIIACGPVAYEAIMAAELLVKKHIKPEVILSPSVKPLDETTILTSVKKTRAVVTVEDHQITGGLGGAVAELLTESYLAPLERVGVANTFGESGPPAELWKAYGLDRTHVVAAAERAVKRKV